jgi:hypothetical protein
MAKWKEGETKPGLSHQLNFEKRVMKMKSE